MERALQDLNAMEQKLLGEVRKQRQAIEASGFSAVCFTEAGKDEKINSSDTHSRLGTNATSLHAVTKLEMNANRFTPESSDMKEDNVIERGPRRAPPANSDKLPLPWAGRLGYVRYHAYPSGQETG